MGNKDSRAATDVYGLQNGSASSPNHTADRRTVAAPPYSASSSRHSVPGNSSNGVGSGPNGGSSSLSSSSSHRPSHQHAQLPRGSTGAMGAGPSAAGAPPPLFPAGPPPNRGLYQYPGAQAPSNVSSMQSSPASGPPPSYPSYPGSAGSSLPGRSPLIPAPSPPHIPPVPSLQSSSSQAPPRIPRNR